MLSPLTRFPSTTTKTHATKRPIKLVPRRIRTPLIPPRLLRPLLIMPIHNTITRHLYRTERNLRASTTSPRLQDLLLPIQPSGRDPPFLRQFLLLQPLLPLLYRLLGFLLRCPYVRLERLARGDDVLGTRGVPGGREDVFGSLGAGAGVGG